MAKLATPDPTRNAYAADIDLAAHFRVSRATIWRWVNERQFPAPLKLSPQITRWRWNDVRIWEAEQSSDASRASAA